MEGNVFTTAAVGGRPSGGREGFPGSARRSLGSAGAPGLGYASAPAPPFYWGGGGRRSCLWGRLLLLRSADRGPNTPAASLRDARLTDGRAGQSPLGSLARWTFPASRLGGGEGGPS